MANEVVCNRKSQSNKCISQGLLHVATWYRGIPGQMFTKIAWDLDLLRTNARHRAEFHRARPNDVRETTAKWSYVKQKKTQNAKPKQQTAKTKPKPKTNTQL